MGSLLIRAKAAFLARIFDNPGEIKRHPPAGVIARPGTAKGASKSANDHPSELIQEMQGVPAATGLSGVHHVVQTGQRL